MLDAVSSLIVLLENRLQKEKDPTELTELRRTLTTAKKLEEKRRRAYCS